MADAAWRRIWGRRNPEAVKLREEASPLARAEQAMADGKVSPPLSVEVGWHVAISATSPQRT
eukprot:260294-Pyramimonas_sp.AAC.1